MFSSRKSHFLLSIINFHAFSTYNVKRRHFLAPFFIFFCCYFDAEFYGEFKFEIKFFTTKTTFDRKMRFSENR